MADPRQTPPHPADGSRKTQPELTPQRFVRPPRKAEPDPDEPPGTKSDRDL
jgi:hypothetical protein